jgi:diacylglycerol kinase family enzyme
VFHYINLLGLGFTADVGELTNRRFKGLGTAGYIAAVVSRLAKLEAPSDPIRVDDDTHGDARRAVFLSFSNSRFTGGAMEMAPHADPSDGELDIIRVSEMGRSELLRAFPGIFKGTHVEHEKVESRRARTVEFLEQRKQPVMVDGEILELALERLEVLPGALQVVT